jgi:hypothetical protein
LEPPVQLEDVEVAGNALGIPTLQARSKACVHSQTTSVHAAALLALKPWSKHVLQAGLPDAAVAPCEAL